MTRTLALIILASLALNTRTEPAPTLHIGFVLYERDEATHQPHLILGNSDNHYSMDITKAYDIDSVSMPGKCLVTQKPTVTIDSIAKCITLHCALTLCSDNTHIDYTETIDFGEKIETEVHKNYYLSLNSVIETNRD